MTKQTILIVEDEERIAHWVKSYFERAGFRAVVAHDGKTGLDLAESGDPALIILDLMLPGLDGREICRRVRRASDVPIIMLTARDAQQDRISGLDMGADDYVVKPFDPEELVARAKAVLRRTSGAVAETLTTGDFTIRFDASTLACSGKTIPLSRLQFSLMAAFMRHPNQTLTREQLLDLAFENDFDGFDRAVDAHIRRLRRLIEPDPGRPRHIVTVYGFGYKFVA